MKQSYRRHHRRWTIDYLTFCSSWRPLKSFEKRHQTFSSYSAFILFFFLRSERGSDIFRKKSHPNPLLCFFLLSRRYFLLLLPLKKRKKTFDSCLMQTLVKGSQSIPFRDRVTLIRAPFVFLLHFPTIISIFECVRQSNWRKP